MANRKVTSKRCPEGRKANVLYRVDEDGETWGMCMRAFDCSEDDGGDCPLSGKTRRK